MHSLGAESIAKLTARGSGFSVGLGGIPEITESDICYALARIQAVGPGLLLRVKFAHQMQFWADLRTELLRLQPFAPTRFRFMLAELAIREFCAPALCSTCNGRESYRAGDLLIICPDCNGSGKFRRKEPHLELDIDMRQWRILCSHYEAMLRRLASWESVGVGALQQIFD